MAVQIIAIRICIVYKPITARLYCIISQPERSILNSIEI